MGEPAGAAAACDDRAAMLARFYDWEHDALTADLALYVELARLARGPVLELGCGTGRVLAALGRAGITAVGVDSAPSMLARAAARLAREALPADRVRTVEADARTLALPERFALVLAPLDFLGYFPEQADQRAVLATARRHLLPYGQLVIDVAFPEATLADQPRGVLVHQWTRAAADGSVVTKTWVREVDPWAQIQHLTAFYDQAGPDGQARRWVNELQLRYYHRFELALLVTAAGFQVEHVWGDYARGEAGPASERLVLVARPAENKTGPAAGVSALE